MKTVTPAATMLPSSVYVSPLLPPMMPTLVSRPAEGCWLSLPSTFTWTRFDPSTETATVCAVPAVSVLSQSTNGSVVDALAAGTEPLTTALIVTTSEVASETVTVQIPLAFVVQVCAAAEHRGAGDRELDRRVLRAETALRHRRGDGRDPDAVGRIAVGATTATPGRAGDVRAEVRQRRADRVRGGVDRRRQRDRRADGSR